MKHLTKAACDEIISKLTENDAINYSALAEHIIDRFGITINKSNFRKSLKVVHTVLNHVSTDSNGLRLVKETIGKDGNVTSQTRAVRKDNKVDTDGFEVVGVTTTPFGSNYVKYRKVEDIEESENNIEGLLNELNGAFERTSPPTSDGHGIGVVSLADFHYGLDYKGDVKNPAFNVDMLAEKVSLVADKINRMKYKEVHLALLGDFIESFTGVNHENSWKHLSHYGRTAIVGVAKLINEHLISKINNLAKVYIISGNHDRVSKKNDLDSVGEGAGLIADILELMTDVEIAFDYSILTPTIDGIKYIFHHGHLGLSKQDVLSTVLEFGEQKAYNVIIGGHWHSRDVRKGTKLVKEYKKNTVSLEGSNWRKITAPPLVTGNAYSFSIGKFGTAGMTITEANNDKSNINHFDFAL